MLNVNATRTLLYGGLTGAVCIVAYGFAMLTSANYAPATPTLPQQAPVSSLAAIIARHLIRRGTIIAAADLDTLPVAATLPVGVQTATAGVIGKIAIDDIPATQFVLTDQISADPARAGLAMLVPAGLRAVELRIDDEIAVGTLIRPGDHVDVQVVLPDSVMPGTDVGRRQDGNASEAHTLLQNIIVLALGNRLVGDALPDADPNRKVDRPTGVTLAMSPYQLSEFVLARSIGTLFLALRNPSDPQTVAQDTAELEDVRGAAGAVATGKHPIELITGTQRRTIYSLTAGRGQ